MDDEVRGGGGSQISVLGIYLYILLNPIIAISYFLKLGI